MQPWRRVQAGHGYTGLKVPASYMILSRSDFQPDVMFPVVLSAGLGWLFGVPWVVGAFFPMCRKPRFQSRSAIVAWILNVVMSVVLIALIITAAVVASKHHQDSDSSFNDALPPSSSTGGSSGPTKPCCSLTCEITSCGDLNVECCSDNCVSGRAGIHFYCNNVFRVFPCDTSC